ncbi:Ig-like domain-containing protein [Anaerocolumna xylanovorans]|uniref:Ig-like domain (Group 2) n=1 Tax=Anaerocolumna xylanovorans DSM 12503 TaxID=1121345 RepID=A0A1M7Y6R3_9FIRM|nr:Ig-like domain-containing protein [Anaerocolumna xylanovorans]SHO48333.1 Ig-like domain (group 2) [Anaerocolumna xylanovorans DSM 12503]
MKKSLKLLTSILLCITIIASYTLIYEQRTEAATVKISNTTLTLSAGKTQTLKITGTTSTVSWSSSNKKVATVSTGGKVTAVSNGSAVITAKVGSKKYTCKVKVQGSQKLSKNWKDLEFTMNGEAYKLFFDFKQLKDNGWDFNLSDYGHDSYVMNSGDKITGTIYLNNTKYDSEIIAGFINTDKKAKDIKKCKIWTININNRFAKNPVSFALPGGIKSGSTLKEVVKAYGKPDETYRAADMGYWVYTYSSNYEKYFKLEIDDKKGVLGMTMQLYD